MKQVIGGASDGGRERVIDNTEMQQSITVATGELAQLKDGA